MPDDQLAEAQSLTHVGSWEWDVATNQVRWSDELYRIFGLEPGSVPAGMEAYLANVHPDDRPAVGTAIGTTLETGEPFDFEHRVVLPAEEDACTLDATAETIQIRWVRCRGRLIRGPDQSCVDTGQPADGVRPPVRMVGASQDITTRREAEAALAALALHDPLTGLPNRGLLMDRMTQGLLRLQRSDSVLAVLFVDLDRFKTINDRLGHAAGDEVLVTLAGRLRDVLRPHDTIARLGGDEFAVLCEDLVDEGAATCVARRVLVALDKPILIADHNKGSQEVRTSASIGISTTSRPDVTPDALLRDADMAMYRAKELGRNRIEIFDHSARTRTEARLQTAEELRKAVDFGQLRVLYQPKITLDGPGLSWPSPGIRTTGVEALVRWQHPTRGLLGPTEFIQLAEETGVVVPLGAWVVHQACRDLMALDEAGIGPLTLSINLSARQLGSSQLTALVGDVLIETGLDPARLCFEITESILMDDVESSIEALESLRRLGVRLAIDDFGTGYSSLSYLRRFPVHTVKLDRAFVGGLGTDSAADAIVAAVINLAHALGLEVVAEGVETHEQLTVLQALRCDRGQGFHWSEPLAREALVQWLQAHSAGELEPQPVDLRKVLADRIAGLRVRSQPAASEQAVILRTPPQLAAAYADEGAVRNVVDHLLNNAVTYSSPDRPVVVSATADRRWVRFSVADYGIGMSTEEANRCFEPFWQAGTGERDPGERSGTGVGLYIVRSLVEAMGGHVSVVSARGAGSTFTVALPRTAPRFSGRTGGRAGSRRPDPGSLPPGVGEESSIREFMRQLGVPNRRGA